MNILKSIIISFLSALILTTTAHADWPPYQCPSIEQIQTAANDETRESKTRCTTSECTFDLINPVIGNWYFFMNLTATPSNVKSKALEALKSLSFKSGPTFESRIYYFCRYTNSAGYEAKAIAYF
jgi:hypothetical protein